MRKFTYKNKLTGRNVVVEAHNLDVLYEKIKDKYVGNVFTSDGNHKWNEIAMPQEKKK